MDNEIITGQQSSWAIIKKLGEGDAGEVYLVESLVGGRIGVLKRPQKSAFTGDVLRQATQIKNEGQILQSLAGINISSNGFKVQVPELLDLSKPGADYSDRVFIIIEKASGLDLNFLGRIGRMGIPDRETTQDDEAQGLSLPESILVNAIAENGHIPDRILLTCLVAMLETLHFIHLKPFELGETAMEGYIYNDVKPEHIFWNPDSQTITLIDWGNAQFVTKGGMSRNRQYSTRDDYRQFVDGMGLFLGSTAPDLRLRLEWPGVTSDFIPATDVSGDDLFQPGGLIERLESAIKR